MEHSFSTQLVRVDSDLYHYVFYVPLEVAESLKSRDISRLVCTVNKQLSFHCALLSDGKGGTVISLNKARIKKLGLVREQIFEVKLIEDKTEYGMPISDELREVLYQDDAASEIFHGLTKGKQRTLIYWSDNVKSSDIKIRRALVLCNHLVESQGEIDFKQLGRDIKEANNRAKLA